MFIDLKRAFDTVNPNRLARKLKQLGLSENAVKLMHSYLVNRKTATTIGKNSSDFATVNVGVAQGSKFGPLHFITYINDLLKMLFFGRLLLYADDAALVYICDSAADLERLMAQDLAILNDWLNRNVLTLNPNKTCYMTFFKGKNIPDFNISIDGHTINRVRTYKYLGLVIDEDLKFDKHVDHVKMLIRPFISLMWRNGKYVPMVRRRALYYAYVQSHLLYMLPIYGECGVTKLKELQILQNRCVKAMYRFHKLTSTTYLYSTSLMPISEMVTVEKVTNLHKMILSLTKHNFRFASISGTHGRELRNNDEIYIPNSYSRSITTTAALTLACSEYNKLDMDVRQLTCLKTFKSKI